MVKPVSTKQLFMNTLELPEKAKASSKSRLQAPAVSSLKCLRTERSFRLGPGAARVPIGVTLGLLGVSQSCARGPGVLVDPDQHAAQEYVAASRAALALYEELLSEGFDRLSMGRQDEKILERLPGGRYHIGPFTDELVTLEYRAPMGERRREVLGISHVRRRLGELMS